MSAAATSRLSPASKYPPNVKELRRDTRADAVTVTVTSQTNTAAIDGSISNLRPRIRPMSRRGDSYAAAVPYPTDFGLDPASEPSSGTSHAGPNGGGATLGARVDSDLDPDIEPDPHPSHMTQLQPPSQPYLEVLPPDDRPATPSPLLFQPLSPFQSQYSSSPSAPPSISSLPSNSVSASGSPSLLPYVYQASPNPYRVGIGIPASPLSRPFPQSSQPESPISSSSVHQHGLNHADQTPIARRYAGDVLDTTSSSNMDDIDDDDPISRDSKDVLVQRLADLAQRVSLSPSQEVGALHIKVDEMERSLTSQSHNGYATPSSRRFPPILRQSYSQSNLPNSHQPSGTLRSLSGDFANPPGSDPQGDRFWQSAGPSGRSPPWLRTRVSDGSPLSKRGQGQFIPASFNAMGLRLGPRAVSGSGANSVGHLSVAGDLDDDDIDSKPPETRRMVPIEDMKRVVDEAERLNTEIETMITNLRARQEESDHIHSLLVERAERAAQRIIFLQGRVSHLEDELQENDTELQNLRLQLKAIEVQCPPPDAMDADLRQSIENWKSDWAKLRQKRTAKMKAAASSLFYEEPTRTSDLGSLQFAHKDNT